MSDEPRPRRAAREQAADLYARHSEELLGFFRAMLPMAKVDAKDLLQQTFIELLKWLDGDRQRTIVHPRGLLFSIARRRVLAYRERRGRTPSALARGDIESELHTDSVAMQDDLEYLASLYEDRRGVLRAIRRLNQSDADHPVSDLQLAVYLRFFAGMTETQVGEVLGCSRGSIAGQLNRVRAVLAKTLAELDEFEPGIARTSTTLLERWWRQVEARAEEVVPSTSEPAEPTEPTKYADCP